MQNWGHFFEDSLVFLSSKNMARSKTRRSFAQPHPHLMRNIDQDAVKNHESVNFFTLTYQK